MANSLDKINHIVVLMMENRSFDHMLGFLKSPGYPIEGLTGTESNPVSFLPGAQRITVSPDAHASHDLSVDPNHDVDHVNVQLFGYATGPNPAISARNQGFIVDYAAQKGSTPSTAPNIMRCFSEENLPVLSTLAKEFTVCDHWFASMAGPTWPNRYFVHCATSDGQVDSKRINRRTIYDNLSAQNVSWFIYFGDVAQSWAIKSLALSGNSGPWGTVFSGIWYFADAAQRGALPAYTFIEPRYLIAPNDQHPDHDIHHGENFIADIYEALRSSPAWNETLLIVVYDEHGGIHDHVTPPEAVNPDGKIFQSPQFNYAFDRLGPRVPAILISPWIPRDIDHTVYDHTSILATVKKRFGLPDFLTRRDAAAATFEDRLSLTAPRTDAPMTLPRAAGAFALEAPTIWPEKTNDFQQDMQALSAELSQDPEAHPNVRSVAARVYNRKDPI